MKHLLIASIFLFIPLGAFADERKDKSSMKPSILLLKNMEKA